MATYLNKTLGTATNRKKFTISAWCKRSDAGDVDYIMAAGTDSNNYIDDLRFDGAGKLIFDGYSTGSTYRLKTNRLFRDVAAWYHVVVRYDSTQSTSSERLKMYVNGEGQTDFETATYPTLNYETFFNKNVEHMVGRNLNGSGYYSGYIAQLIFVDGSALSEASFGSFNSDGVWIPNNSPSITYGNNGFKLDFADSGASAATGNFGSDSSGNNNHFASNSLGTYPNTKDTPQNNFCILSNIDNQSVALSKGGLDFDSSGGNDEGIRGTMGVLAGKWYYECKITGSAGLSAGNIGFAQPTYKLKNNPRGGQGMFVNGSASLNLFNFSSSGTSLDAGAGVVQNDIIGFALNLTDNQLTVYKNGTQVGSTQTIASGLTSSGEFFLPVIVDDGGSNDVVGSFNFGNPTFTIASSNSDANGYGSFEYAVPSGYYALCTKNLATYG